MLLRGFAGKVGSFRDGAVRPIKSGGRWGDVAICVDVVVYLVRSLWSPGRGLHLSASRVVAELASTVNGQPLVANDGPFSRFLSNLGLRRDWPLSRLLPLARDTEPARVARADPGIALCVGEPSWSNQWKSFSALPLDSRWRFDLFTIRTRGHVQGRRHWSPSRVVVVQATRQSAFWQGKDDPLFADKAKGKSGSSSDRPAVPAIDGYPPGEGSAQDAEHIEERQDGLEQNGEDHDGDHGVGEGEGLEFLKALEALLEEEGVFDEEGPFVVEHLGGDVAGEPDVSCPPDVLAAVAAAVVGLFDEVVVVPEAGGEVGAVEPAAEPAPLPPLPPPAPPVPPKRRARHDAYPRLQHPHGPGPVGEHDLRLVDTATNRD